MRSAPTFALTFVAGLLGVFVISLAAGFATAHADPARPCMATQPCLQPQYCPDTGEFVVGYEPCPSLVTGPYAPGGLMPNGDSDR